MKKIAFYSKSRRPCLVDAPGPPRRAEAAATGVHGSASTPVQSRSRQPRLLRLRQFITRHERAFLVVCSTLLSAFLLFAYMAGKPQARQITQKDIDAAVMHTLERTVLPSPEVKAFAAVRRSIVRVRDLGQSGDKAGPGRVTGVGTGVVIVDTGIILTNLHVVAGADSVRVVFFDGLESDARVISVQPQNDLAVLQAKNIPDDLVAATLRSAQDLAIGDKVIAVGFPFGIGPSVSSGIVSGLRRQYQSPEGERLLSNLIQFDAAANPGNSGGPLITMDGEVVGIVTGILNPNPESVFIGIAFAVPIETAAAAAGELPF